MKRMAIVLSLLFCVYRSPAQKTKSNYRRTYHALELGTALFGGRYFDEQTGPNGYKSHSETIKAISLAYLHEWQIAKRLYTGIGIGYEHMEVAPDYKVETVIINGLSYDKYIDVPVPDYDLIPLWNQTRYYFRSKPNSGFVFLDLGSFFKLDHNEGKSRLKWGIGIGNRYEIAHKKYLTWSLDMYEYYLHRNANPDKGYNANPRLACLGLKLGFVFN